jgi:hypothetical protein
MRRELTVALVALAPFSILGGNASAANPRASCNGVLVSSLAGQPGVVAQLTRAFHQEFKDAGLPPGSFDAAGAQEHAGGVDECLAALAP